MVRERNPEKRERFLRVALALFAAHGVQNTTTAEIAKVAGTASGTLFLYFPTKLDLIHELVLTITIAQSEFIKSLLDPSLSVRETFYTIWDGSVRWFLDHMDAYRFAQQVRDSNLIADAVVAETGTHFTFYYETIRRGHEEGSIKPYPIDLIGGFLFQEVVAMMEYIRREADATTRDTSIEQGFDLFWDGITINQTRAV